MTETFNLLAELGKAALIVSGLLIACCTSGAILSVIVNWPAHWEQWKEKREKKMARVIRPAHFQRSGLPRQVHSQSDRWCEVTTTVIRGGIDSGFGS